MARKNNTADTVWEQIKADYISTSISMRELAEKYDVSLSATKRKCWKEGWGELRTEFRTNKDKEVVQILSEKAAEQTVDILVKINNIASELADKLELAVKQLDTQQMKKKIKSWETDEEGNKISIEKEEIDLQEGIVNTLSAQQISNTLKTIKEIVMNSEEDTEDIFGVVMLPGVLDESEDSMETTSKAD